jgi:hypothetical protein
MITFKRPNKRIRQIYSQALLMAEIQAGRESIRSSNRVCPATVHLQVDFQRTCTSCHETRCEKMAAIGLNDNGDALPFKSRPTCGAMIRIGAICANRVIPGKTKCHMHGGKSTGPKTAEGKARVAEAQRQRWARYRAKIETKTS